jgi:exonuclease-1
MCIFSGCDYLPSIPGFGLKKAYIAMKQHGSFTKVRPHDLGGIDVAF